MTCLRSLSIHFQTMIRKFRLLPRYSKLLIIVFHTQGWVRISSCCWLLYGIHLRNLCTDIVGHFFKYFNFCGALLGSNKSYMPSYFMTYVIKHGIGSNKSRTDKICNNPFFFFWVNNPVIEYCGVLSHYLFFIISLFFIRTDKIAMIFVIV